MRPPATSLLGATSTCNVYLSAPVQPRRPQPRDSNGCTVKLKPSSAPVLSLSPRFKFYRCSGLQLAVRFGLSLLFLSRCND
jgi:hypothetical protein